MLHDRNNHWLHSLCSSGRVQQPENSLRNHAGQFILKSLNALYRNFKDTSSGKLTLSFLPVQKQEDGFNCGAITTAYAAKILDGKSPTDARFDVPAMRNHLISWLMKRDPRPFPKVKQDNE